MSGNWLPEELADVGAGFGETSLEEQHERVVILTNAQEMRLMVSVYGYPEDVDRYLEGIDSRLVFFAGDDLPFIEDDSDDNLDDGFEDANIRSPLVIRFRLLHDDEYQPLAILIDPEFDVVIGAGADAHFYPHGNRLVKSTIRADAGELRMYRGTPGQPGTAQRAVLSGDPQQHLISRKDTYVKGFDANGNVYDLFILYMRG